MSATNLTRNQDVAGSFGRASGPNENLAEDIAEIVDNADLEDDQQTKLEREFAREYHLVPREDRLEKIAGDLVANYSGRGALAKAMVISIDKATVARMCDKVQNL
jgi:type I restriction enzyme, R subunit